jgi:hypothetical protein
VPLTTRARTKAGRKGDATPKAAYIAAYSSRKRGSAVDRRACPSGLWITTTGALLGCHRGNKAQIRGLRRNNDVSGPRSLLVTTVPPGPSSARVILRRAALGRPRPTHAQSLGPRACGPVLFYPSRTAPAGCPMAVSMGVARAGRGDKGCMTASGPVDCTLLPMRHRPARPWHQYPCREPLLRVGVIMKGMVRTAPQATLSPPVGRRG